ncbi:Aliphatic sulfonates import ATP-binding protein SsuB [Serratia proteamaculans]|jgi:putative hydroxymethylpyrimidine transport system ATP-binding protein|uniref:ABC transporter ATP-binding protein n=1 Tax=Serratia proteamaculans TaxID=28151 RepID=A0ABS0TN71_SERPR|nr:ABC transporter ATP-binding protein [Serratia proteamaculans]SPZ55687.1 Aliphatic sulfonates import ATP-binding protein SsuB [Serratia quinivorans]KAB1499195.1 ABC transporter ATP-binding protein [Serratia proteamaculans]MBI6179781.1 ABC transporter ATP-binding protein [Serratia proteamaculans]RYM50151.1 nitrate/sulfonate/bicarbonate ABC transporter ATP-binding protein [Serratia proteamaculans]RYM53282.1 nitrate/sulfonate/bicarbonate ABC transporter ATP-binding protein [Serratia proteamacul
MSIGNAQHDGVRPGIQVRDLTLRFGQQVIFDRLSFDIAGGSFVTLLGASGAGKTSLLKIIAGLAKPTAGTVIGSDGQPIAGRIAYMGQKDLLYPWLTIDQNISLGARLRGEKVDRPWAEHLLERVGLNGYGNALPAALSGGMRQRAAIARTLYERQPIVLMDEPFSALDTITRAMIQTLAADLLAQHTVLLITHDPMEACRLSHRLLVLSRYPAGIDDSHIIEGLPPRAPDDPQLLKSQSELLLQLVRAAG